MPRTSADHTAPCRYRHPCAESGHAGRVAGGRAGFADYKRYPDVQTTILAASGEIQLHFKTRAETSDAAQQRVDEAAGAVEDELDDFVFSRNGEPLEQIVGYYLQMRNATVSVAESYRRPSSGTHYVDQRQLAIFCRRRRRVFEQIEDQPAGLGSDDEKHGAVSSEVAAALAEGIRYRCESTFGIGITGIAGPTGGSPEKSVGLVFHSLASNSGTEVVERQFPGDRKLIRRSLVRWPWIW